MVYRKTFHDGRWMADEVYARGMKYMVLGTGFALLQMSYGSTGRGRARVPVIEQWMNGR